MNSELTEKTDIKEWRSSERPGGLGAAAPRADSFGGWIVYDRDCSSCTASARRFDRIFRRRGFLFLPLQTDWVMKRLDLEPGAPLEEMRVLTSNGRDIGGADAVIFLGRQIWWARPFVALARLPGMHNVLDRGYRWIAAHRGCDHIGCSLKERRSLDRRFCKSAAEKPPLLEFWPAWIPLIGFPPLALLARNHVAPWQFMWLMAGAIFLGCKWLTFWSARRQIVHVRVGRALAYLLLWPGLDAKPIMKAPLRSKSVSEFWGRRWNDAFNRLALDFVFRPLARGQGIRIATLAAFLVSGLVHELVISLPARGGYGLPTAYFLLQGTGILTERALPQIRGQIFTIVITAVPAFWLFHPPFVRNVILPFMKAIGAL